MYIVKNRIKFFVLVGIITVVSLLAIAVYGLKPSIEFTGGNLVEVRYAGIRPDQPRVMTQLVAEGITHEASIRPVDDNAYMIRMPSLSAEEQAKLKSALSFEGAGAEITRMTDVGPTIGTELYRKSLVAIVLVVLSILIYLAFAFRKPSSDKKDKNQEAVDDVSSWWYGMIAVITLIHDIIVPTGMIAILGHYTGAQVDTLFITALLTILGYSVNDTIIILDRVRENIRNNAKAKEKHSFEYLVGKGLTETYGRSINTSVSALLSLVALYVFGPESTHIFALTLIVGVVVGTYSSIFLAAPLLVAIRNRKK